MLHNAYGPHGAEDEREPETLWVDLAEAAGDEFPAAEAERAVTMPRPPLASHNDPLGSWTGTPTVDSGDPENEVPTQDADDL